MSRNKLALHVEHAVGVVIIAMGLAGPYLSQLNRIAWQYPGTLHLGPWHIEIVAKQKSDISAALQQCVSAPNVVGIVCHLPPGAFEMTKTVKIPAKVTIMGRGTLITGLMKDGESMFEIGGTP